MYSKEDLNKLIANLEKIERFCKENYIHRILNREDRISVDFGPMETYPGQWRQEPRCSFGMDGRGNIWFRIGGLFLHFDDNKEPSIYKNNVYGEELLLNWGKVRTLIEDELTALAKRKNILDEFEV